MGGGKGCGGGGGGGRGGGGCGGLGEGGVGGGGGEGGRGGDRTVLCTTGVSALCAKSTLLHREMSYNDALKKLLAT